MLHVESSIDFWLPVWWLKHRFLLRFPSSNLLSRVLVWAVQYQHRVRHFDCWQARSSLFALVKRDLRLGQELEVWWMVAWPRVWFRHLLFVKDIAESCVERLLGSHAVCCHGDWVSGWLWLLQILVRWSYLCCMSCCSARCEVWRVLSRGLVVQKDALSSLLQVGCTRVLEAVWDLPFPGWGKVLAAFSLSEAWESVHDMLRCSPLSGWPSIELIREHHALVSPVVSLPFPCLTLLNSSIIYLDLRVAPPLKNTSPHAVRVVHVQRRGVPSLNSYLLGCVFHRWRLYNVCLLYRLLVSRFYV